MQMDLGETVIGDGEKDGWGGGRYEDCVCLLVCCSIFNPQPPRASARASTLALVLALAKMVLGVLGQ